LPTTPVVGYEISSLRDFLRHPNINFTSTYSQARDRGTKMTTHGVRSKPTDVNRNCWE